MKYVYNKERDRLASKAWDPHFFIATFKEEATAELRSMMLHTCTDLKRNMTAIAEKYANTGEVLIEVKEIPRRIYEKWLCGEIEIKVNEEIIPTSYITDFLIAEDAPSDEKGTSRYGDLSQMKKLLMERDANLMQSLLESWELASSKHDIVREEKEPENDRWHESLLKD